MTHPPKGSRGGGGKGSSGRARSSGRAGRRRASERSESTAVGSAAGKAPRGKAAGDKKEQDEDVSAFVRGLTETERVTLIVRDELFGGSWESYQKDLEARAPGRPNGIKQASRIQDHRKALEKLRRVEGRHGVNLTDYLGEGR